MLFSLLLSPLHYFYKAAESKNIVVDPVMVATSGDRLISEEAVDTLKSCLLYFYKAAESGAPNPPLLLN